MSKYNAIFKIYFDGTADSSTQGLNLTFFGPEKSEIILDDFPTFLLKFEELARKKKTHSIGNIKEIISLGRADKSVITQFFTLLYTIHISDDNNQKAGVLIGNHKEFGHVVLGIWPYGSITNASLSSEDFNNLFIQVVSNSENFKDMLLIR
jgi:hypothetical protein